MVSVTSVRTLSRVMIDRATLDRWPSGLLAAGHRVIAPVSTGGESEYRELNQQSSIASSLFDGLPRQSPKAAWFPRTEPIVKLKRNGREWAFEDPEREFPRIVIFGARPCDAAAPDILAPLFGWDYHDTFFEERLKQLVFVVAACSAPVDGACFCTSVNIDPAGQSAGDLLLTEMGDGKVLAEARTEAGEALLAAIPEAERASVDADPPGLAELRNRSRQSITAKFNPADVQAALQKRFKDPLWEQSARSCLACGTCAFVCPTCHCFDIQDEMVGNTGVRQKNWDACAFPLFTLHTSGHNPRPDQSSRWRQRLNHKFNYYPEKFNKVLCTGCGRCMRLCPAGMDLLADLQDLAKSNGAAAAPAPAQALVMPPAETAAPSSPTNIYRPYLMRIADLRDETPDVRTLRLEFTEPKEAEQFTYRVGQFGLYTAPGEGESTFCIASSCTRKGYIECTFRQAGRVTQALRRLNLGDLMGFRGPYGNSFPVESWRGKNLLFIAGGIALPPMRSVIQYCLDKREDYRDITIVYGARTWSDHVYKHELAEWEARPDVNLWLCIDWKPVNGNLVEEPADEGWRPLNLKDPSASVLDPSHRRYTGFVPHLVEAAKPSPRDCIAILCGPPIMIKFTLASLKKLGFSPDNVYTTLENRMKCGVGKCGRCNVGPVYICKEGPVFTAAQVEAMPPEL